MHQTTVQCDMCEVEYMLTSEMELPPGWIGVQLLIADVEGIIPEHEQEVYNHFCSVKCLGAFCTGPVVRKRLAYADRQQHGNRKRKKSNENGEGPDGDSADPMA